MGFGWDVGTAFPILRLGKAEKHILDAFGCLLWVLTPTKGQEGLEIGYGVTFKLLPKPIFFCEFSTVKRGGGRSLNYARSQRNATQHHPAHARPAEHSKMHTAPGSTAAQYSTAQHGTVQCKAAQQSITLIPQ